MTRLPGDNRTPAFVEAPLAAARAAEMLRHMDTIDAQNRLICLQAERHQARELGVESASPYMTRLEVALEDARVGYVMSAVRDIAVLRRSLTRATQA